MNTVKYKAWTDEGMINVSRITFAGDVLYVVSDNDAHDGYELEITPDKLRLWTGLKDKNGKEIYEGDIVRTPSYPAKHQTSPVIFREGSFGIYLDGTALYDSEDIHGRGWIEISQSSYQPEEDFEVIGNVWENPELLKEQA